jgi:histidine triad (HIT) family protein
MHDCVFCKIVVGEMPSEKVYEDENTVAFLDISPVSKGHVLVVPKKHYKDFLETPVEVLENTIRTIKKVAPKLVIAVEADGFNIGLNNGEASGQVVKHLHWHIIPRYSNDNLRMWGGVSYAEGEMKEYGNKIRRFTIEL